MKTNDKITIIPSIALSEMRMDRLVGRRGKVTKIIYKKDRRVYGCWVLLDGAPFLDNHEWFIPFDSFTEG